MENVGIFYVCLEYITVIWYILRPFGNLDTIWYILLLFGILCQEKSGNPAHQSFFLKANLIIKFVKNSFGRSGD
jgi:hypothetical protein